MSPLFRDFTLLCSCALDPIMRLRECWTTPVLRPSYPAAGNTSRAPDMPIRQQLASLLLRQELRLGQSHSFIHCRQLVRFASVRR